MVNRRPPGRTVGPHRAGQPALRPPGVRFGAERAGHCCQRGCRGPHVLRLGRLAGAAHGLRGFSFAFEWVFIAAGLFASNVEAAQGLALIIVPFTFVSSAYVLVSSMPGWLHACAENQPVTYMIDAVRSLTGGAPAEALLGHPSSYFVVRSLMWTAAIVLVFATIGVARYRRG
jgi:ABC-2 type transporter